MARPTDKNLLTFRENNTGKLVELAHADASFLQTITASIGTAPTSYALLARYMNAVLFYDPSLLAGAIGLLESRGTLTYTWIAQSAIDDIDDQGCAGLLVDPQYRILFVQQVPPTAVEADQFKVRRFDVFGKIDTFTFTLPADPFGAGSPELLPMGTWQGDVGFWGSALSPDGSTLYLLTRQYLYACTFADSTMTVLVDFGGDAVMGNGGLACRPADGHLFAGIVQLEPNLTEWFQSYWVNIYDAAGAPVDQKLISRSSSLPSPSGTGSFGQFFDLGTNDAELWTYFSNLNDNPTFVDTDDLVQHDMFLGGTPVPPMLIQYRADHYPGLAAKLNPDASVAWAKFYANPLP